VDLQFADKRSRYLSRENLHEISRLLDDKSAARVACVWFAGDGKNADTNRQVQYRTTLAGFMRFL
jgi:hypothetical protein